MVDDDRVVSAPREVDGRARPPLSSLELGDVGDAPLPRAGGVTGKDPDEPVADLDGIAGDRQARHRPAEQIVGNADHSTLTVVGPAVVGASEVAAVDFAERQRELPVRAAILQHPELAVAAAIEGERRVPEDDLDDLAWPHRPVVLDG
jgi:hypothetical protein